MKKIFNQDSLIFGLVAGAVLPWAFFGILYGMSHWVFKWQYSVSLIQTSTLMLISLIGNMLLMRYYFVKRNFEQTGKGILVFTFSYIILLFIYDYLIK